MTTDDQEQPIHVEFLIVTNLAMAIPSADEPSTKDRTKRKRNGLYDLTKQFSVNGRKQLKNQTKNEKSRRFSKMNQQWITRKNRHLLRRRQIRVKKKQKQALQNNRKEDSIGCMHTYRLNEIDNPCSGKGSRRVDFIDSQNDYENGQSFYRASSKLRNISQNEYPINFNISEARDYTYDTHIINDPMVGDLNLRCYRFGSTLVWNELNLGHTIPFESLAFLDSILSFDFPPFGNTRIIHSMEITLGHTNPIPVCMIGHTRPFLEDNSS